MLTTNFITTRLTEVVAERGVTVGYANESGSRAWGLANTDSDYDVRFVYQHSHPPLLRPPGKNHPHAVRHSPEDH